jgi:hypothetical protein
VRECASWYLSARDILPDAVKDERLLLVMRNRTLILGLIRSIRRDNGRAGRFEP